MNYIKLPGAKAPQSSLAGFKEIHVKAKAHKVNYSDKVRALRIKSFMKNICPDYYLKGLDIYNLKPLGTQP
jgi:hypothetical protein